MPRNTILVTGAAGTIGTQLVRELLQAGADFAVLGREADPRAVPPVRAARFEDPATLEAAFQGIDTLFVLLPLVPHKLELARNVAQAARAAGVRHIVRSSGAGADTQAAFSLPRLQGEVDAIFAATGIPCTFLRPASFMQNMVNFTGDMVRAGHLVAASADAPQSLVDVCDIAAVAAQLLLHPQDHAGKAYTLTGDEALTDSQRAAVLSQVLGRPVSFEAIALEAADQGMRDAGYPPEIVDWMGSLNRIVSAGYAGGTTGDVEALLGRKPIRFAQFVRDHADRWQ